MSVLSDMQFGKLGDGMVRLSIDGKLAVKVGNSYKTYNAKTGHLVNCDQFVFKVGQDFFFVMPTNKIKSGDIILINGKPVYVLDVPGKNKIEILDYFDGSIKTILPERHTFLGGSYLYSKIVSMFGTKGFDKNTLMKYMMMNTLFGDNCGNPFASSGSGINPMVMMMMLSGKNPMADMFNFSDESEELFGGLLDLASEADEDTDTDEVDTEAIDE